MKVSISSSKVWKMTTPTRMDLLQFSKISIITAINLNDLALLRKCVEQGANVNEHYSEFLTAIEKGNIKIIEYLIQNGASISNKGNLEIRRTPLVVAIRNNCSLEIVQLLVENGADVNENDSFGRLPLNEALTLNKIPVVMYLIEHGADINQIDHSGATPISLAVMGNNLETVKYLVWKGADLHKSDAEGNSAITLAQRLSDLTIYQYLQNRTIFENSSAYRIKKPVRLMWSEVQYYDSLKEVEILLAEEATETTEYEDPILTCNKSCENTIVVALRSENNCLQDEEHGNSNKSLKQINSSRSSNNAKCEGQEQMPCQVIQSLEDAICHGSFEDLKSMVFDKTTINKLDALGFSPLANAITCERIDMVNYLLSLGANTCKTVNGKTPLLLSVQKENLEIMELLLQHGAKHTIQTAFFEAIKLEKLEIVKFLLNREVLLDLIYKDGSTPLIKSIETNNFQIMKTLVENGANVNMPDRNGKLPLTVSLEIGNVDTVSYLANNNAILPCQFIEMCPYLPKYIEANNLKMITVLVELLKIKLNVKFNCGYSPLTKATELENIKMVKFLLKNYAEGVNEPDNNNKTPLSIAATSQNLPILKFLLQSGADFNLAKEEIEEYAKNSEDLALYLENRKK